MTLGVTDDSNYNSIANAIRSMSSSGTSQTMTPAEMAYAIQALKATWGHVDGTLADQTDLKTALDNKANINSPEFVGSPKAITPEKGTNNTQLATTAFVHSGLVDKADINSPAFTGVPKAPTAEKGTNDTQIATTAFVQNGLSDVYTKTESDTLFADKALEDNVYTKSEIDTFVESKADVISNTLSGEIVSISDGTDNPVEDLVVGIDPVQDLNGYDYPWPAGGGKNKLPNRYSQLSNKGITATLNSDGSLTLNGTADGNAYISGDTFTLPAGSYKLSGCPSGGGSSTYRMYFHPLGASVSADTGNGKTFTIEEDTEVYLQIQIFSGQVFSNKVFYPMLCYQSDLADTYAPYSNICSITGWDACKVTRTGKNLIQISSDFDRSINPNIIRTYENNKVSFSGTISSKNSSLYIQDITSFVKGKGVVTASQIIVSGTMTNLNIRINEVNNGTVLNRWGFIGGSKTFTVQDNNNYELIISTGNNDSVIGATVDVTFYIQFEIGSVATEYEPYNSQTVTIDLGSTRYGGSLDVPTGVLTVDRVSATINGTESWSKSSVTDCDIYMNSSSKYGNLQYETLLSHFKFVVGSQANAVGCAWRGSSDSQLRIGFAEYGTTTVTDFTNWLLENPVQIITNLAEPITVQLTPTEVRTLLGHNNVWADTGAILQLTYKADTKGYVDYAVEHVEQSETATRNMITQTEESMVASKNYAIGDLLIINNQLLRAKQSIGTGNTITIGTSGNTEVIDLSTVINPYIQDSGWLSLTNTSVFTGTIHYRKVGKTVYVFADSVKLVSELTTDSVTLATIPSGFRPSYFVASAYAGNVNERGMVAIQQSNGNLIFYKNSDTASFGTSGRLNFSITYFTN